MTNSNAVGLTRLTRAEVTGGAFPGIPRIYHVTNVSFFNWFNFIYETVSITATRLQSISEEGTEWKCGFWRMSHLYHHHQTTSDDSPALTTTPVCPFTSTVPPDQLSSHHRHLESLLDSALATVTLINAAATQKTPLRYSSRMTQIIRALGHYILTPTLDPEASAGLDTTTGTTTDNPHHAPTPATYAAVASPITSDHHTTKQMSRSPPPPSVSPQPSAAQSVAIRFDLNTAHIPIRPSSEALYLAIQDALADPALLGGVHWSQRGNLILHAPREVHTARYLLKRRAAIWAAIHPLLGLPKEYPQPVFETDARWHSVVFHGVPTSTASARDFLDTKGAQLWLDGCTGTVKAISVLCRQDDLKTKSSVAVRLSLSSEADAQRFVANGGSFHGTVCRVSYYIKRPRGDTPAL
ncbi:hypothetical protein C8R43DRAFT_99995 [Mycena crocata]|nr:hypothetical protein C8R43DRAFT_99995 [Mycena crocata]